jgi:hypothetical protein
MKMSEWKIWLSSFLAVSGLGIVGACFLIPSAAVPGFLLTVVTVLLTIFVPTAIIPKGEHTPVKVLIGALYGLFWPLGLPIVIAVVFCNLFPDPTKTQDEVLSKHNQGS